MAKEFFESLPSQETPFNASRWNGLLNGNESMGSIVVEDIICKNLFNFDNMRMDYATLDHANKTLTFNSYNNATLNTLRDICPDLVVGETYTFSFKTTSEIKYIYLEGSQYTWGNGESHTITQEDLDSYILFYGSSSVDCTISNIQIENGKVITEYVPYKNFDNTFKNNVLFSWGNVETDKIYTLTDGKKFSDYKLIEFVTERTSIIKSYSSLCNSNSKIFQLIYYEKPSQGKTEILIQLEYISDTQFRCNMSAYTSDGVGFGNNPYPIEIIGVI